MRNKYDLSFPCLAGLVSALVFVLALSGCAAPIPEIMPEPRVETAGAEAVLSYYQGLGRMSAAELARESTVLIALRSHPLAQMKMAMLLGHPRAQQDLGKGLALLEGILKSVDPAAQPFQALAREVADNYQERIRLENQLEKQGQQLGQQLKESQRKAAELQEKLDGLADIEKTLIPRARTLRPNGAGR